MVILFEVLLSDSWNLKVFSRNFLMQGDSECDLLSLVPAWFTAHPTDRPSAKNLLGQLMLLCLPSWVCAFMASSWCPDTSLQCVSKGSQTVQGQSAPLYFVFIPYIRAPPQGGSPGVMVHGSLLCSAGSPFHTFQRPQEV